MRKLIFHRTSAINEDTVPAAATPQAQTTTVQTAVPATTTPTTTAQAPAASTTQNAAVFSQSISNLKGLIDSVPTLTAALDSYSKGNHADVVQKMTQFNQRIPATVINSAMSSMTQILELYGQCTADFAASQSALNAQKQAATAAQQSSQSAGQENAAQQSQSSQAQQQASTK